MFKTLADKVGNTDDGDSVSDGETVDVKMFGAFSGQVSDFCNNTKRWNRVSHQADMAHHRTTDGDSGGPWVDHDGKLLGLHHGAGGSGGNSWSVAAVGRHALNGGLMTLSK